MKEDYSYSLENNEPFKLTKKELMSYNEILPLANQKGYPLIGEYYMGTYHVGCGYYTDEAGWEWFSNEYEIPEE